MPTEVQLHFLHDAAQEAKAAGHIFPQIAACEAAVESSWGVSELALRANNLFGAKTPVAPKYPSISLPTREFLQGMWRVISANFVRYPSMADAFSDRMATLHRLAGDYPHYAAALAAQTPEGFVTEVSKSWSTAPDRAANCIAIYHAHKEMLDAAVA